MNKRICGATVHFLHNGTTALVINRRQGKTNRISGVYLLSKPKINKMISTLLLRSTSVSRTMYGDLSIIIGG